MLADSRLPTRFWAEAIACACHTQNRSIYVKRHKKTAYEVLRNRKPNVGYFHVFGCPVYILNDSSQLGKFDAKADEGYFLGYSVIKKAFRFYNKRTLKVDESIHVTFDESNSAINHKPSTDTPSVPPIHFGESDPINYNKGDSQEAASTKTEVEPILPKSSATTPFYPSVTFQPSHSLTIGSDVLNQILLKLLLLKEPKKFFQLKK